MLRVRGLDEQLCLQQVEEVNTNRGCGRTIDGHLYSFCSDCSDLQESCPHGVQSVQTVLHSTL